MHWRAFLALIIVIGIIGLMTQGDIAKNLLGGLKVGGFAKTKEVQEGFSIVLSSEKEAFYGQTYKVSNATFSSEGICQPIKLNEMTLEKSLRCHIAIIDLTGQFEYASVGSIKVVGESSSANIDGSIYSSAVPIKIDLEIIPFNFTLATISENKISLTSVSGDIKRLKNDTLEAITYLDASSLDISNFVGEIKLVNGLVVLTGTATSVEGQNFSW